MTLNASGIMRIGDTDAGSPITSNNDIINIELDRSGTTANSSLDENSLRFLAEKTTAFSTISFSDFYGKTYVPYWLGFYLNAGGSLHCPARPTFDSTGNCYVSFDYVTTNYTISVLKLLANGSNVWQTIFTSGAINVEGAANDGANTYVSGRIGTGAAFLAKYNTSGTLLWQKSLGALEDFFSVTVETSGRSNVFVTGANGTANSNTLIAKYDTSGNLLWQRKISAATSKLEYGTSICIDTTSNVYVGMLTASSPSLVKYNRDGTLQWQRYVGTGASNTLMVSTDTTSNVYFLNGVGNLGSSDTVTIGKYNTNGSLIWQRKLTAPSGNNLYVGGTEYSRIGPEAKGDIVSDANNDVYATFTARTPDFRYSICIVKYDSNGSLLWQKKFYRTVDNYLSRGINVNLSDKSLYVTGMAYISGVSERIVLLKVPTSGIGNGTYGNTGWIYADSDFTDSAGALSNSASSLTSATTSLKASTPTYSTGTDNIVKSVIRIN